ncbi:MULTISPECIES: TonB-dependent receptor domain-containing protein [unclassified Chryseobacterium]|uniref:TonB-dependent receptor domain-containing protein n=1 Tax=unclassified Chryseobacterium TaxID=2593645 RepID=UPI00100AC0EA|nr:MULTISPECIES: TonB-dependent receptor [unclassified Chryseobacterium]RXM53389.1 TonB-dependent receptor [Chryseobacterium sp. CH25]RXM65408.1 TonB-dependent receptor [Chryseobacterium sp. CH1]
MKNKTEIVNIFTRKALGLTLVLSAAAMAFAQEKADVSGTIVNKKNQPVPYASVTFSNKANKALSDAVLTDEKGQYKLQLTPGSYDIAVEAIDYKKSIINKNITGAGNIGALSIEASATSTLDGKTNEIQGVVITAAATKAYKVELDKKTYDPSQDIVSKGGNLQDVLTNVPSVSVDTDGTVSMRGNSNVKFLINGKPSSLLGIDDGANALQSIPADQIERIEVITNPSSKFEASGTAGILNIILKKDKKMGFNGTVTGTLGYLPRTNLNANLNWRKGNWTWFLNGGGGYQKNESTMKNTTTRKDDISSLSSDAFPFTQYSQQNGKTTRESDTYNVTAGFTHDFSDKTSINFSGMIRSFDTDQTGLNAYNERLYTSPTSGVINVLRNRNSYGNNKNLATQFDFGIDQKIGDNGQLLSASASYQTNKTDGTNKIVQRTFVENILQPNGVVNNVITDSKTDTFIGKIDYELPIGEKSKLEAGARYDYNRNTYDYFVDQSDNEQPAYTRYDFTSNTVYSEKILGVYAQFKSKIGEKFAYQLGLRSETSQIDVNFQNYDVNGNPANTPEVNKNYTKFFPSVFLSYDLAKNNQILLNYSRRINRPRAFSLIPFMSFDDDRNYFRGNPNLNPTYENSFELGYNLSNKKITFNPTLYFRKSEDEQNRYQYIDQTGAVNTIPFNVGTETNYGLDLNGTYDPFNWWKIMLSADLYGYKNTGSYNLFPDDPKTLNDFSGTGFSYRLRFNNTFKPTKTLSLQIQSFYRAAEKTAMNNRKAMYGIDLGISQTIWKGNGIIGFNIRDIFNTRKMKNFSDNAQFTREMEMQWQPRQFALSFTYKFKQGEKVDAKPKIKKDINSNTKGDDEQGGGPM